jgi:hypothetical protein
VGETCGGDSSDVSSANDRKSVILGRAHERKERDLIKRHGSDAILS